MTQNKVAEKDSASRGRLQSKRTIRLSSHCKADVWTGVERGEGVSPVVGTWRVHAEYQGTWRVHAEYQGSWRVNAKGQGPWGVHAKYPVPGECMPSTRNILCLNETEFWQVALGKSDNSGKNSETIGGDRQGLSSHPCSSEN